MGVSPSTIAVTRRRAPSSWVLTPVVAALVVAMLVMHWLDRNADITTWWTGNVGLTVALGGFGILLVHRLPANPIGWLMIIGGLGQGIVGIGREWAVYADVTHRGQLPGAAWGAWIGSWPWVVSIGSLPAVLVLFPDGHVTGRWTRRLLWAIAGSTAAVCVTAAVIPGTFTEDLPALTNPIGIDWLPTVEVSTIAQLGLMATIVAAVGVLVSRWSGSTGELRQQLKWIALAAALLALELVYELLPWRLPGSGIGWLPLVFVALFLAAITVSVLRFRLWDVDALISVSLVYGSLTVLLGGGYVAIVALSDRFRARPVDLGSSLVAAIAVAVAFAPLRDWLQRRLDRRLYGDRGDPYRALASVSDRLGDPDHAGEMLGEVADALAGSLRLAGVELHVAGRGAVASCGRIGAATHRVPLVFRGVTVGELVVAGRPGTTLGRRERAVLADVAPVLAAGVHAVAVSDELHESRLQVITAREEERRRVRRDLHDGLGPALAAVRMQLDGAALMIGNDPDAARDVLDHLSRDVAEAIADIRRLVQGLRPPALDELGLAPALAEQAAAFSGPVEGGGYLDVRLDAGDGVDALPAAVEVAAYRIVSESLTNVARHARAARCRVSLSLDAERSALHVLVDDDGIGVDGREAGRGVGSVSMVERAAELGGRCRVGRSPLGGARVEAWIPVPSP